MMTKRTIEVGDTVDVNAFSWDGKERRAAFVGKVTFSGCGYFNVMDDDGVEWHRTAGELTLVGVKAERRAA